MSDSDLIAQFLAKNEVKVLPMGARTLSNSELKRAIGWEPDVVVKPSEEIHEVIDHAGRSFYHNNEGEWL